MPYLTIVFIDLPYLSETISQVENICNRIETKDITNIYYLFASGTIEEWIADHVEQKQSKVDLLSMWSDIPDSLIKWAKS